MTERVAIVGSAMMAGPSRERSLQELIFEVTRRCLDGAGMARDSVESVVLAASDLADGVGISSMITATAGGAYLKDEIKVAGDGIFGAILGYLRVGSGQYSSTLVVSWGRSWVGAMAPIPGLPADPFFLRPAGITEVTALALQAERYLARFGLGEEIGALVAAKNLANGLENPLACRAMAVSEDEVNRSRPLAWPLRDLTFPPSSEGAAAILMVAEPLVKDLRVRPIWIRGAGWSTEPYELGDREPAGWGSLRQAAGRAYAAAGIRDPGRELGAAEVSDVTAFHELMSYEALGLCAPGGGARLAADGVTSLKGGLPVNASGGLLACHPQPASGLFRLIESALQVDGAAGSHQAGAVTTALAHGTHGLGGQASGVVIAGRD